jgi:hypothetical protein
MMGLATCFEIATRSFPITGNREVMRGPGLCAAGVPEIADRERHLLG